MKFFNILTFLIASAVLLPISGMAMQDLGKQLKQLEKQVTWVEGARQISVKQRLKILDSAVEDYKKIVISPMQPQFVRTNPGHAGRCYAVISKIVELQQKFEKEAASQEADDSSIAAAIQQNEEESKEREHANRAREEQEQGDRAIARRLEQGDGYRAPVAAPSGGMAFEQDQLQRAMAESREMEAKRQAVAQRVQQQRPAVLVPRVRPVPSAPIQQPAQAPIFPGNPQRIDAPAVPRQDAGEILIPARAPAPQASEQDQIAVAIAVSREEAQQYRDGLGRVYRGQDEIVDLNPPQAQQPAVVRATPQSWFTRNWPRLAAAAVIAAVVTWWFWKH